MAEITTPAGITLEYETAGSETDPPLLMVSDFGAQLVAWPRGFCERLAAGGRFVISYDNRDCGLSSKLDGRLVDMDAVNATAAAGDFARAEGSSRQLAAIVASGSRADGLRALHVPTLVIHGLDDTLVAASGGERTAELIPDAALILVPDMGHDRPEPLWPTLGTAILAHTA